MKKDWGKRIGELERSIKLLYGKQLFEEWIQKNYDNPPEDYLALAEIVPQEFRLECILLGLANLRANPPSS